MSNRVAILLKTFPDIPIWEWLEELATNELQRESDGRKQQVIVHKRDAYQCMHCGTPSSGHMGASRHHKMVHVNRRSDCGIQTPLEGECIKSSK